MDTLGALEGMKVVVSPDRPKMQLAPGDYITPAFREEIDAWLLSFFGTVNMIPDGQVLAMPSMSIITVNPRTYAALKGITS